MQELLTFEHNIALRMKLTNGNLAGVLSSKMDLPVLGKLLEIQAMQCSRKIIISDALN